MKTRFGSDGPPARRGTGDWGANSGARWRARSVSGGLAICALRRLCSSQLCRFNLKGDGGGEVAAAGPVRRRGAKRSFLVTQWSRIRFPSSRSRGRSGQQRRRTEMALLCMSKRFPLVTHSSRWHTAPCVCATAERLHVPPGLRSVHHCR